MKNNLSNKKFELPKTINVKSIITIFSTVLVVAAHVIAILIGIYAFRYYNMYPTLFICLFTVLICVYAIIDIILFVGLKQKDLIQKSIVGFISLMILIGGIYGTSLLKQTNELVDNVIANEGEDLYETVSGVFVSFDDRELEECNSVADLKTQGTLRVGSLAETSTDSIASLGLAELDTVGVSYESKGYTNNTNLLFALINREVDVAIFTGMYQSIFKADENVDYTQYLDMMHEIDTFEKDILIKSNTSTKDLSKDPFNVLLIGWSPVEGSKTIGLADAIIVASVNPQTYTVSMMSIARDSYVPISCYGGECDKINSGRGTSMDCFVSTVENLIKEEIDFYMEIDFSGFADLCGHFGGIEIDNPVSFELDGVYVPAGHYIADGWQALQFARERHHMPNGDFDRQQHQKEVIMQLAKQYLSHSLSDALDSFNFVSNRLNTNMTLNQLTGMFNMLTSTKNYTGLSMFDMIDMHALRITGYGSWHYSDEYELPLWIYKLYDGSVSESLNHMEEVLGNYKTINQDASFAFSIEEPYVRAAFYSTEYDEVETHETLPPYYVNLTSMTYKEALEWATNNGAILTVSFIDEDDAEYDESLDGYVVSQSVAYGKKVSKYPVCNVTVMGNGKKKIDIPEYYGWDLERAVVWAKEQEVKVVKQLAYVANTSEYKENDVTKITYDRDTETITIYYASKCIGGVTDGVCDIVKFKVATTQNSPTKGSTTGDGEYAYNSVVTVVANVASENYVFKGWVDSSGKTVSTEAKYSFTLTGNTSLKAMFDDAKSYTIEVVSSNTDQGTVSGGGTYLEGKSINISAAGKGNYMFSSWSDGDKNASRTITVKGAAKYTASFVAKPKYTVSVVSSDTGKGSVSGGGTDYLDNTVQISASANEGYVFTGWSDGDGNATRTVTIKGDVTYTATFAAKQYTVSVASNNTDYGTVSGGGSGPNGTEVAISASPNEGYKFVSWSDGGEQSHSVVINGDTTYTATFAPVE